MRFNERIIQPIRQLDQYQIIGAVQELEKCQRSVDTPGALATNLRTTAQASDEIISRMRDILAAMEDSETYQEVVNKVIELKRSEEKVRQMTQEKQKQASEEDIFDKEDDDGSTKKDNKGG